MTKIVVCGADGRMGRELLRLAENGNKLQVVASVDSKFKNNGKNKFSTLAEFTEPQVDVLIDFTVASQFSSILKWCLKNEIALVSGTTGLTNKDKEEMTVASKKIPIFWAPNMSMGVSFVAYLLERYSQISNFDFKISETHHKDKKDKPSGTAIFLQTALEEAIGRKIKTPESIREGDVFGDHKIIASTESEEIILEHKALNREVFARGALSAVTWLAGQKPGLYNMKNLLGKQNGE